MSGAGITNAAAVCVVVGVMCRVQFAFVYDVDGFMLVVYGSDDVCVVDRVGGLIDDA